VVSGVERLTVRPALEQIQGEIKPDGSCSW